MQRHGCNVITSTTVDLYHPQKRTQQHNKANEEYNWQRKHSESISVEGNKLPSKMWRNIVF